MGDADAMRTIRDTEELYAQRMDRYVTAMPDRPPAAAPALPEPAVPPGVCMPWENKLRELPALTRDRGLCERIWKEVDSLAYSYIRNVLLC